MLEKRKPREKSTAVLNISLFPSEKEEIKKWVELEKTTISNFVRTAIDLYIKYLEEKYKNTPKPSEEKSKSVE